MVVGVPGHRGQCVRNRAMVAERQGVELAPIPLLAMMEGHVKDSRPKKISATWKLAQVRIDILLKFNSSGIR